MAMFKPVTVKETKYGTYSLHFNDINGKRRRISIGKDMQYARRIAVKFENWLLEGKDPEQELKRVQREEQTKSITIREFFPLFMERHGVQNSDSMQRSYQNSFAMVCLCPQLANCELASVSKKLVLDFMHLRVKEHDVKPSTANKDAAFLKCMLSKAHEWEMIERNPLRGLKMLKTNDKRIVNISPKEVEMLLDELSQPLSDIVEFAIFTGFRKENILSLRIDAITFYEVYPEGNPAGEVELLVKGGRSESYPLSPMAVEIAQRAMGNRKRGYVFLNPSTKSRYTSINKAFDIAVRKLGLTINDGTKLRFHDLRHVFATWLHQDGVSLDQLRSLLGHRSRSTTDRYAYLDRVSVGSVLSRMPRLHRSSTNKVS